MSKMRDALRKLHKKDSRPRLRGQSTLVRSQFRRSKSATPTPADNIHLTDLQYRSLLDHLWQIDLALDRVRRELRKAAGQARKKEPSKP